MAVAILPRLARGLLKKAASYSTPSAISPWPRMQPVINLEEKDELEAVSTVGSAKLLLEKKRQAFLCE